MGSVSSSASREKGCRPEPVCRHDSETGVRTVLASWGGDRGTRRVAIDYTGLLESIIQVIPKLFDGLSTIADLDGRRLDLGLPGSMAVRIKKFKAIPANNTLQLTWDPVRR